MGRSPRCSKEGLNRGTWSAKEDMILSEYIRIHGHGRWANLPPKAGLKRSGKSCRLRWLNYLRPDIKRGNISPDEEELIIRLHRLLGNRWSLIAGRLPERTDNEIKNYWSTHLSKKLLLMNQSSTTPNLKKSTRNSHKGFQSCHVKETKNSSKPFSRDLPAVVADSITKNDSQPIAKDSRNSTCSMSSLVECGRSPDSDSCAGDATILAESLLDLSELSTPDCNLLSSPSEFCTDFGLEEFYMEPATLATEAIEFEVTCSDQTNMQSVNSFSFASYQEKEDLYGNTQDLDWIFELDYAKK